MDWKCGLLFKYNN